MFNQLEIAAKALGLARHAAERQGLVASNIANADTPGYRARDLPAFADLWRDGAGLPMHASRAGHIAEAGAPHGTRPHAISAASGTTSPNGNSVSLEAEMVRGAEIQQRHEMALAVYRKGLSILSATLGRRG